MGIFSFLKKLISPSATQPCATTVSQPSYTATTKSVARSVATPAAPTTPQAAPKAKATPKNKLTYSEKELLAVKRTALQDMQQLKGFPYVWNRTVEKCITPNGHPFAYMDIVGPNITVARSELESMNIHIEHAKQLCKKLPRGLCIPVTGVIFSRNLESAYSRLICSPVDHNGDPVNLPLKLSFTTGFNSSNSSEGELCYGQDGRIHAATFYFWRGHNGYFLYYESVDEKLVLSRIEVPDLTGVRNIIYKGPHILAREAARIQEEKDFVWLQANIPDKCPASISGFRRMKTQNTKNYQLLQQLAADLGRKI